MGCTHPSEGVVLGLSLLIPTMDMTIGDFMACPAPYCSFSVLLEHLLSAVSVAVPWVRTPCMHARELCCLELSCTVVRCKHFGAVLLGILPAVEYCVLLLRRCSAARHHAA
jgi:hypothetical protein